MKNAKRPIATFLVIALTGLVAIGCSEEKPSRGGGTSPSYTVGKDYRDKPAASTQSGSNRSRR